MCGLGYSRAHWILWGLLRRLSLLALRLSRGWRVRLLRGVTGQRVLRLQLGKGYSWAVRKVRGIGDIRCLVRRLGQASALLRGRKRHERRDCEEQYCCPRHPHDHPFPCCHRHLRRRMNDLTGSLQIGKTLGRCIPRLAFRGCFRRENLEATHGLVGGFEHFEKTIDPHQLQDHRRGWRYRSQFGLRHASWPLPDNAAASRLPRYPCIGSASNPKQYRDDLPPTAAAVRSEKTLLPRDSVFLAAPSQLRDPGFACDLLLNKVVVVTKLPGVEHLARLL